MENKKACLFDFDGTLVDSMPVWRDKMFRLLKLQDIDPPAGLLREITPLGDAGTLRYFREHFRLTMSDDEMKREMDSYALPYYRNWIAAKDGVCECLKELKVKGIGLYVLTASPRRMYEPCLERLGMLSFFEQTWCCEDFLTVKSDPDIYRLAAAKMDADMKDIAFFDDNRTALFTAKTAGLYTVGVFDETSAEDEAQIRRITDRYIRSFYEL